MKVGEAIDVASLVAGGASVAVPPRFIAVGLSNIAGTLGWVYTVVVAESPDPPATLPDVGSVEMTFSSTAARRAQPPTAAENILARVTLIVCSNGDR